MKEGIDYEFTINGKTANVKIEADGFELSIDDPNPVEFNSTISTDVVEMPKLIND